MTNSFSVLTYSPSDVELVIAGYSIAGWDSISISRRTDSFKPIFGIRNKHTRVRAGSATTRDTSAMITFSLSQESASNDVLSYIHDLDIDQGTARIVLTLKDKSGKSVFSSDEAYIISYPQASFTNDFSNRDWRIFCQSTKTYLVGGNSRPQTSIFDTAINAASSFVSNIF